MLAVPARGVPEELIRGYLLSDFDGRDQPDGSVHGDGWV